MKELGKSRRRFKSRKEPTPVYPANPPPVPASLDVLFLAINPAREQEAAVFEDRIVTSQILYKPGLLGIARIIFQGGRWEVHVEREIAQVIHFPPQPLPSDWEKSLVGKWDSKLALTDHQAGSFFVCDHTHDFSESRIESLQEEFIQYLITNEILEIEYNPSLKLYRRLDESEEAFSDRCVELTRKNFENEMKNLEETMQRLQDRLKEKLEREVREIGSEQLEMQSLKGSKQSLRKFKERSPADVQHEIDVRESISAIEDINRQFVEVGHLKEEKIREFEETVHNIASEREKDLLRISHGNVQVLRFALLWLPYTEYVIQEEDRRRIVLLQSF